MGDCGGALLRSTVLTIPDPLAMRTLDTHAGILDEGRIAVLAWKALNVVDAAIKEAERAGTDISCRCRCRCRCRLEALASRSAPGRHARLAFEIVSLGVGIDAPGETLSSVAVVEVNVKDDDAVNAVLEVGVRGCHHRIVYPAKARRTRTGTVVAGRTRNDKGTTGWQCRWWMRKELGMVLHLWQRRGQGRAA